MQQGPPRPPQGPGVPPRPPQGGGQGPGGGAPGQPQGGGHGGAQGGPPRPPQPQGPFSGFISNLTALPFWVQEAVFFKLKEKIQAAYPQGDVFAMGKDIYQLVVPQMTFQGKKELQTRMLALGNDTYRFMAQTTNNQSIAEITINNFWTLEKTSKIFADLYAREFYMPLGDDKLIVTAAYLGGTIRLGEYLKRLGITDLETIDKVLKAQKDGDLQGQHIPVGQIFTNMGIIKEEDIKHVLMLKSDADKQVMLKFDNRPPM